MKIGWLAANPKKRKIGQRSKQGPAALTKQKQDNFDQIHAHNVVKQNGVIVFTARKKILEGEYLKKFKSLPQAFLGLVLPTHVNKVLIHLVTQSL